MANEPIRKDAGIVSAYGAAVRGGYTGTYDEFCQQQATYAETAAAVQQAKVDAEAAAGRAENAATATAQDKTDADAAARAASQSKTDAETAATNAGQSKTAAEDAAGRAEAAIESYDEMTAEAETLPAGSDATAEIDRTGDHPVLELGIPKGDQGDPGVSPTVAVTEITGGHRVVITDDDGPHQFDVMDGEDSAVLSVNGETGAVVLDGTKVNVNNSAQTPVTVAEELGNLNRALNALDEEKYEKPSGGIPASDLADGVIPDVPVQDVQVDGQSVVDGQGVADIPLGELADRKADVIVASASGAIASFADGADNMPLKGCVVQIEPVQDLHGYDNPWPAGGSKNKIPLSVDGFKAINTIGTWDGNSYTENGIVYTVQLDNDGNVVGVNVNGTASSNSFFKYVERLAVSAGTYVLNGAPSDASTETFTHYAYTSTAYFDTGSGVNVTIDSTMPNIIIRVMSGVSVSDKLFKPMFRLASETDSAFAPYSNICPITGWTGANVQRVGKNLIDPSDIALANNDTYVWVKRGTGIMFRKGYTYTFSIGNLHSSTIRLMTVEESTIINAGSDKSVSYTPDEDIAVVIRVSDTNAYTLSEVTNSLQLEISSTASEYEPYQGQTYPISWQTEAGTVYGGTLDVTTGVLTVDKSFVTYDGSSDESWGAYGVGSDNFCAYIAISDKMIGYQKSICNAFNNVNTAFALTTFGIYSDHPTLTNTYFRMPNASVTTLEEFKSWLSNNPIQLCYELAEPQTYHLTPTEIRTILGGGINNIWADTGDVAVEYPADTKAYVDGAVPAVPVTDVQVNGTSVVQDGVANVPLAGASTPGVSKVDSSLGINITNGYLFIATPIDNDLKIGYGGYKPIVPSKQHISTFYGLAKAAGDSTQSASSNAVGTYTNEAKLAIQKMLGVGGSWTLITQETTSEDKTFYYVDLNGNYKELAIEITNLQTTSANNAMNMFFGINGAVVQTGHNCLNTNGSPVQPTSTSYKTMAKAILKINDLGWPDGELQVTNGVNQNGTGKLLTRFDFDANLQSISSFTFFLANASTNQIASGATFTVYAR